MPRNNFELHPARDQFLFIAGGIGITPILSMMRALRRSGRAQFQLIYCTRDAAGTAFRDVLQAEFGDQVRLHHDHGDPEQAIDLWPEFESPGRAQVYCCGPRGLMDAVADMSGHWPSGAIHFESFGVDASQYAANQPFTVRLQRSGQRDPVAADQSILEALRAPVTRCPVPAKAAPAASCRTGCWSGEAEHRDMVLLDEDKRSQIMVCVSRARAAANWCWIVGRRTGARSCRHIAARRILRIGVAGLGRAFTLMLPTFTGDARVRLVAAADPLPQARAQFGRDFGRPTHDNGRGLVRRPGGAGGLYRHAAPVPCRTCADRRGPWQACAGRKADGDHPGAMPAR